MNVLPLVLSFFFILAISVSAVFQGYFSLALEKKNLEGYLNTHFRIWNKHQQNFLNQAPEKPQATPPDPPAHSSSETKENSREKRIYFRDKKCSHESGKLNLYPLLHDLDSVNAKHLYEPAAKLIVELYEKTPFWKMGEDLEYQILDGLMKKKELSFYDAFSKDDALASIFYRMVKGSNTYLVGIGEGIPPFFDFFRDDDSGKVNYKIDFLHAPKAVLKVFLGEALLQQVENLERKTNESLSNEKFQSLLQNFPQKKAELDELNLFIFGKKKDTGAFVMIDDETGITLKSR